MKFKFLINFHRYKKKLYDQFLKNKLYLQKCKQTTMRQLLEVEKVNENICGVYIKNISFRILN